MKILLYSRWLWEENRRFAGQGTVQELAETMAALGHEIVVLSQSPEVHRLEKAHRGIGSLETWLTPRHTKKRGWIGLRDKVAKFRYSHRKVHTDALDLGEFLKKRGPFDILWAQTEEPDGLICAIAKRRGIPLPRLVVQIQALRTKFINRQMIYTEREPLRLALGAAQRILANSEFIADQIARYYVPKSLTASQLRAKTGIVYPNLTRAFLDAHAQNGIRDPESQRILFLGALNEVKGPLIFLEALRLIVDQAPISSIGLVGDYTEKDPVFRSRWQSELQKTQSYLQQVRPGLEIELLGRIPSDQVIEQIQRASVVVAPSVYDPFSRVVAESLALGRPVLTTDQVGAGRLIFGYPEHQAPGKIVPAQNASALGQALVEILSASSLYLDNARRVATTVSHQLSLQEIAKQVLDEFTASAPHLL